MTFTDAERPTRTMTVTEDPQGVKVRIVSGESIVVDYYIAYHDVPAVAEALCRVSRAG